jgi:hypothetical protein
MVGPGRDGRAEGGEDQHDFERNCHFFLGEIAPPELKVKEERPCSFHLSLLRIHRSSPPIIRLIGPLWASPPTGQPNHEKGGKALTKNSYICNHQTEQPREQTLEIF